MQNEVLSLVQEINTKGQELAQKLEQLIRSFISQIDLDEVKRELAYVRCLEVEVSKQRFVLGYDSEDDAICLRMQYRVILFAVTEGKVLLCPLEQLYIDKEVIRQALEQLQAQARQLQLCATAQLLDTTRKIIETIIEIVEKNTSFNGLIRDSVYCRTLVSFSALYIM